MADSSEWKLMNEEIKIERNAHNDARYTQRELNAGRAIAKAQAKKLAGWLEGDCPRHIAFTIIGEMSDRFRRDCDECWEQLRWEME